MIDLSTNLKPWGAAPHPARALPLDPARSAPLDPLKFLRMLNGNCEYFLNFHRSECFHKTVSKVANRKDTISTCH